MAERIEIHAGGVAATISTRGAEPQSLTGPDGHEYLWQAGEAWPKHAPVLFPIVGRVPEDTITVDGRKHALRQHGFARDREWEVVAQSTDAVELRLIDDAATQERFPFAFSLLARYEVGSFGLRTTYTVTNPGPADLPYAIGSHPAFRWPLEDGVAQTDHVVEFAEPEPAPIRRLDRTLILPDPQPTPIDGRVLRLDPALFAPDAVVLDQLASSSLIYRAPSGRGLRLDWSDGFGAFVIWSPPAGAEFVCLEPCSGPATPIEFTGEFATRPSTERVAPGDRREYTYTISPQN